MGRINNRSYNRNFNVQYGYMGYDYRCNDESEVQTGVRQDGTIYSVYSFARKLGQACSSGLSGVLLSIIGYTSVMFLIQR